MKAFEEEQEGNSDAHEQVLKAEDDLHTLTKKKQHLADNGHYLEIATLLLRDQGVKEKIIKQYVPIMNKLINKFLAQLEFYVGFELDEKSLKKQSNLDLEMCSNMKTSLKVRK